MNAIPATDELPLISDLAQLDNDTLTLILDNLVIRQDELVKQAATAPKDFEKLVDDHVFGVRKRLMSLRTHLGQCQSVAARLNDTAKIAKLVSLQERTTTIEAFAHQIHQRVLSVYFAARYRKASQAA